MPLPFCNDCERDAIENEKSLHCPLVKLAKLKAEFK
jgi:hypothetical protein